MLDYFYRSHMHMYLFIHVFEGLTHIETTVGALVEVIHAFTSCNLDTVTMAVQIYIKLLLSEVRKLIS